MAVIINKEICTGCGACVTTCPVEALKMEEGKVVVDESACIDCGACVSECPVQAIKLPE
jgi:NAD-dependent dihydropyrimidine dehydrogenase PreA subunit